MQKFQHLIPALPLLLAGMNALRAGAHGLELLLAVFEVVTSLLLFGSVVREVRALRATDAHASHSSHGVDWFHVFAAGVLLAEALERWHLTHHWPRPMLLTAAVTFGLGIFHHRIQTGAQRRRSLRLNEDGIYLSTRPFSRFRAGWPAVTAIEVGERYATIRTRDGRSSRLDLLDLEDPRPARDALASAQARLSLPAPPIPTAE